MPFPDTLTVEAPVEEWEAVLVLIDRTRDRRRELPDGLEHFAHHLAIELAGVYRAKRTAGAS